MVSRPFGCFALKRWKLPNGGLNKGESIQQKSAKKRNEKRGLWKARRLQILWAQNRGQTGFRIGFKGGGKSGKKGKRDEKFLTPKRNFVRWPTSRYN